MHNTPTYTGIATLLFIGILILSYLFIPLFVFKRRRKAKHLQPPEAQTALRGPGESLRRRYEWYMSRIFETVIVGACLAVAVAVAPGFTLYLFPKANIWLLLASGAALFLALSLVITRRVAQFLDDRANARLGWLGECIVAEHLVEAARAGFRILHDVPFENNGFQANIDHVVIGKGGVVVIETKMRSKPEKQTGSKNEVVYDGERLSWPRFENDTKTLWQVQNNAEWLARYLSTQCEVTVPVKTVIAIPGWLVNEKVLGQPRVVSGKGVADAVIQTTGAGGISLLSPKKIDEIYDALAFRCRDVDIADDEPLKTPSTTDEQSGGGRR